MFEFVLIRDAQMCCVLSVKLKSGNQLRVDMRSAPVAYDRLIIDQGDDNIDFIRYKDK